MFISAGIHPHGPQQSPRKRKPGKSGKPSVARITPPSYPKRFMVTLPPPDTDSDESDEFFYDTPAEAIQHCVRPGPQFFLDTQFYPPQVTIIPGFEQHPGEADETGYDWLAALDFSLGKSDVFALYGSAGLLGGCALWDGENQPGLFYLPNYFPGLDGPWKQPFLWGGTRRSTTHNEIPCVQGRRRGEALSSIAEILPQLAGSRGCYATIVPFMPLHQALAGLIRN
ncbi:hypothetical protein [Erwinia tracheiphila]|uniref:hypothetical protein n=1 Tax=Erwinia tracheiphila TaxID=65700 RepID=UPI0003A53CF3|nr:hypothetical protein [Erwinia tracheiphila]